MLLVVIEFSCNVKLLLFGNLPHFSCVTAQEHPKFVYLSNYQKGLGCTELYRQTVQVPEELSKYSTSDREVRLISCQRHQLQFFPSEHLSNGTERHQAMIYLKYS